MVRSRVSRLALLALLLAGCAGGNPTGPTTPVSTPASASPAPFAEQTFFGRAGYVEYTTGELPVILTAPHGGELRPLEIPDRSYGSLVADASTQEVLREVTTALFVRTGRRPHRIVCNLHRIKLDVNREIVEGAQGSTPAEQAWTEYHGYVDEARRRLMTAHAAGLLLDLHGHGHAVQRLEIGYLVSDTDLDRPDPELAALDLAQTTSIRSLARRTSAPFIELLRGESSLGGLLSARGYRSLPSPGDPSPGGDPYFNGGYTTVRHGSRTAGSIDAIQIEAHMRGVRDTAENRAAYGRALADAVLAFFERHYATRLAP